MNVIGIGLKEKNKGWILFTKNPAFENQASQGIRSGEIGERTEPTSCFSGGW
jgi:hypothetical protein